MGCGDVRLLKTIGSVDFTGQERAALNKLTMPLVMVPPYTVFGSTMTLQPVRGATAVFF